MAIEVDVERLMAHTRVLSSDEFEGRAPGTRGEDLTVAYIAAQMREIGLEPGGDDGYFQSVPLVGIRSLAGTLVCGDLAFEPRVDCVAWSRHPLPEVGIEGADMVFVGYGAEAPECDWDDYQGVDLRGKTMVVLVGDPPVPHPEDPAQLDPAVFGGRALTYHGRWTCKMEKAGEKGAAAVFVVHDTAAAGYPFSVVQGRPHEHFDRAGAEHEHAMVEGWLTPDAARRLFATGGHDFDRLKALAATRNFHPVALGVSATIRVTNEVRRIHSRNVVGVLRGSDEAVLYTAHWDHLGLGPPVDGDPVRHGARDNAIAVACLLETARAFTRAPRPRRSLVFLATTAEEQGLLGAEHYAMHPLFPLEKTLAVLNFEMPNVFGRTRDFIVYGRGLSELDDHAARAAALQGRVLSPDPMPEQGLYFRSDHFPFARRGVPATWSGGGTDYVGRDPGHAARLEADYVANRYHKPADRITSEWDLHGAADDLEVYFEMGRAIASAKTWPAWKSGSPFQRPRSAPRIPDPENGVPLPDGGWRALRVVVGHLIERNWDALTAAGVTARVRPAELEGELQRYGATCIAAPDSAWEAIESIQVQDDLRWHVDVDLWTLEDGQSDLTLSVEIVQNAESGYDVEIEGLHVM